MRSLYKGDKGEREREERESNDGTLCRRVGANT